MSKENRKKRLLSPAPDAPDAARRRLLTGGALTVAASAAAMGRSGASEADDSADALPGNPGDKRALTYRETDHIAAYYARARG